MLILTHLPAFITMVFRGMPGVWKHHRFRHVLKAAYWSVHLLALITVSAASGHIAVERWSHSHGYQ